ncbi:hypothetical protein HN014_06460 [Aquimarina sp. TRL1]|uniref:hypothetical protein n=1 Tax=Aquimarina sp. (strain TRL1) TaxID=2736252 RepID=UPI00158CC598|nr:hypothetical protein [Aquimarina sp. TRL1]QKX04569.1 hypothetical protein HN014_06460 [Aquimarina sp. TRL1]
MTTIFKFYRLITFLLISTFFISCDKEGFESETNHSHEHATIEQKEGEHLTKNKLHKVMTKEAADALATMVVIGYAKDILSSTGKNAIFQYESPKDFATHQKVQDRLKQYVTIDISQSIPKAKFPLIVAKNSRISSTEQAMLTAETETKLAKQLDARLTKMNLGPLYGAYIGGYSDPSKIELVGASDLELYTPKFRGADDSNVKKAFDNAKEYSNKVIDLLNDYNKSISGGVVIGGVRISVKDINPKVTSNFSSGQVFKSFHGMIVAMSKYASSIDKNSFLFEIACSENTTKVSSCFPCATFMASQRNSATSVHLGRGDNWNIPSSCPVFMQTAWQSNIIKWYEIGLRSLKNNSDWNAFISNYSHENIENKLIPQMFLEALTFEDSFTKRILNTLPS